MTAEALAERTIISIKASFTDETGIDLPYVFANLDSAREGALYDKAVKLGNKTIPQQLLQQTFLYFDSDLQPEQDDEINYTIYQLPKVSAISPAITAPVTISPLLGRAYPTFTSFESYAVMSRNASWGNKDSIVIIGDLIYLFGERKDTLRVQGVFASPMSLSTYNPIYDEYPVTGEMYALMELQMVQLYMKALSMRKVDRTSDGKETTIKT